MIYFWISLSIVVLGFASAAVLFFRFPRLPAAKTEFGSLPSLSIIIPARNEGKNLPLLLGDLSAQTFTPLEIICVDDASTDDTAQIARTQGVKLISLRDKPDDWTGKTWACQNGANQAEGELLLFLDADVRLQKDALKRLLQAYSNTRCTISVQPFHRTQKLYEQFSLPFNLIQIAGSGSALPNPCDIGLYGPVILMPKVDYIAIGGHENARKSVVEDMTLGENLKKTNRPYRLFIGDNGISFRMYVGGLSDLLQGWVKNLASGAAKTPLLVFVMIFFWIASMCSPTVQIATYLPSGDLFWVGLYVLLYILWVAILMVLSRRVGRFLFPAILFYPILLVVMLCVFAVSAFHKLFGLNVRWKGRSVPTREQAPKPNDSEAEE